MQTVIITGATSGIGRVTAQKLAQQGWRVIALGLASDEVLELPKGVILHVDITQAQAVQAALSEVQHWLKDGLHGLVNNAGTTLFGALEALEETDLRQQLELNVLAHWRVTCACLPYLRSAQGRIVNVSSIMGRVAMPALGAYSLSKHALEAMSDVWRMELAEQGISVSVVQMGAVATPLSEAMPRRVVYARQHLSEALRSLYGALYDKMLVALNAQNKRASPPEDVTQAIVQALTDKKAKPRYVVGVPARGLLTLRTFAPDEIGDNLLKRALGL